MSVENPSQCCVLYGARPGARSAIAETVERTSTAVSVLAFSSVSELRRELDETEVVGAVVTWYELADGTGLDVLAHVTSTHDDVPVILLVAPSEGLVPVETLSAEFSAVIPVTDGTSVSDRVRDALERLLPDDGDGGDEGDTDDRTGPPSASPGWPTTLWKANVFDQLFDSLPVHIYVKDRDARIVSVTEGPVDERLHPSGESFSGKRDIDGVVPLAEGVDSYLDDMHVIETGEPILDREEFFPSSGRWFLTSKVPLRDEGGEVSGLIGVAREITARKVQERQLKTLGHLLRHNLRTDLNLIKGWTEALDRQADGTLTAHTTRILRAASRLHSTVEHQQEVVDILTEWTVPTTVDVVAVVRHVLDDEQYPGARFDRDLPDEALARVTERFGQAVDELVENAVEHNPRDDPHVAVSVERLDETVRIRIADDGPRIPEAELAVLSGDCEVDPLSHSTGLGLWLVNWIVRQCNGTLSFERNGERGNVAVVTVPAVPESTDVTD
jgi:signal transduction histidine kinase